ncbi:MAG: Arm DNA-binding domain-containing protein [Daejeonella sp.]|uniref:Arm DNA-binding domain-containing protein n=1 Tax=Daejeonella sp. TaxID=2805397 RepID=UPI003C730DD9
MKINEGLSVLFWLYKAKKSKDGMVPIYVRITVNGDRDNFSTGKKIAPSDWDEKNSFVKSVALDYKSVNSYIRKTQSALEKHYNAVAGKKEYSVFGN